MVALSAGSGLG